MSVFIYHSLACIEIVFNCESLLCTESFTVGRNIIMYDNLSNSRCLDGYKIVCSSEKHIISCNLVTVSVRKNKNISITVFSFFDSRKKYEIHVNIKTITCKSITVSPAYHVVKLQWTLLLFTQYFHPVLYKRLSLFANRPSISLTDR